ncbi:MAG TPA: hypothetical protein VF070_47780 [Streptosporangiaceae bacterium]
MPVPDGEMLPLTGFVALAVGVIVAVAYWSLRSGGGPSDTDEPDNRPVLAHQLRERAGQAERQGEAVAKSRLRFGLADRVGWRRGTDVDAELWPQEAFGGVSDEQFWDDLASDKPLATTARTAQPEGRPGHPRARLGERRSGESRSSEPRPGEFRPGDTRPRDPRAAAPRPDGPRPAPASSQGATQAFAVSGPHSAQPAQSAQSTTQAFQIPGFQPAQNTGPQPRAAEPRAAEPRPAPQPYPSQPTQPSWPEAQASSAPSAPPAQHARPAGGRGRHSAGEDPLTSAAYSLRSGGSVDGRSYQASRRARDAREPAALQDTQAFTAADTEAAAGGYHGSTPQHGYDHTTPPYGYDLPSGTARGGPAANGPGRRDGQDGNGGTTAYPYAYGQPGQPGQSRQAGQAMPLTQTPPYGENYRNDHARGSSGDRAAAAGPGQFSTAAAGPGQFSTAAGGPGQFSTAAGGPGQFSTAAGGPGQFSRAPEPRWGSGAWDNGRPAGSGARPDPRDERPAYQGGHPGPYDPRGTGRR